MRAQATTGGHRVTRRDRTVRNTSQRQAIRDVFLRDARPLRVEDVMERAREAVPSINLATVYRNVNRLLEAGTIRRVDFPPLGAHYELADKPHHHHFHCRACDALFELPGCVIDMRKIGLSGFEMEGHEVFLYGLCARCADGR